ncbi:MBL fold metallo-hydrolase [Thauera humireducens]|uniref:MBL fold metallo-hydrolase n=1 Tax=Thauera humireducens TaxID=1134435 RepID=UPI00311FD63D
MVDIVQSPAEAAASGKERIAFPFAPPQPDGELVELAQGIFWARMPMPMQLDHINVYLLRDGDGWFIVDTGLNLPASRTLWESIVERHFEGLPLKGVICTHFHYDHAGLSAWLTERFEAPLYMTHGEYFTMRTLAGPPPSPCRIPCSSSTCVPACRASGSRRCSPNCAAIRSCRLSRGRSTGCAKLRC